MAIGGKHLTNAIPEILYYPADDAIDQEKSDVDAYFRTRDERHLAFRPGEQPTEFHCAPMTGEQWQEIREYALIYDRGTGAYTNALSHGAFVRCVTRIDNAIVDDLGHLGTLPRSRWLSDLPDQARDFVGMMIVNASHYSLCGSEEEVAVDDDIPK